MSDTRTILDQFKRGGRGFTWAEWNALSSEDQAAAIEVQSGLDAEQAALVAYFIMNPKAMFVQIGGPDAAVRGALQGQLK